MTTQLTVVQFQHSGQQYIVPARDFLAHKNIVLPDGSVVEPLGKVKDGKVRVSLNSEPFEGISISEIAHRFNASIAHAKV